MQRQQAKLIESDHISNQTTNTGSSIDCRCVSLVFSSGTRAVDEVTLSVPAGKIMSLVGPSGCGKTTMLRMIAGLEKPTAGEIQITPSIDGAAGEIGFVFQQPSLLRWRTAIENVTLPLELMSSSATQSQNRSTAAQMLQQVGLADSVNLYPHQLSGGMRMRVSIARALVTQPKVLLLDEPFAALDDTLREQLGGLVLDLWTQRPLTIVMVTHNIAEAVMLSHRIAVMRNGKLAETIDNPMPWPRDDSNRSQAPFSDTYQLVRSVMRGDD
ncbi:Bicarbonate transport ATP-binding protein CmpD [Rubripirellula obstinata]|uniref:Bicarbonate transport ATP-binding protein CmpD n=1 Tax=Rubripirellula obstinata TaxID=406547 RepID=A0A5B1CI96_9BACT|nr:Bicarbonate transport ATP-binding protein CmpD [Rubripirellula obstinata]